jgi:predicted SAM-dependent methyltransferase
MPAIEKLHLGCFDIALEGWHNTDVSMHLIIARIPFLSFGMHSLGLMNDIRYQQHKRRTFRKVHYLDATKKFPFPDESLSAVYSSHMLTNFTRALALDCLKEIYRVMRRGGVLRIASPNLDEWVRSYDSNNPDVLLNFLYQPTIQGVKNRFQWLYNPVSMRGLFEESGFKEITECPRFKGKCPDVERIDYREDSFFMEAIK